MKVILVHGIFDDGRLFNVMAKYLKDLECEVFIPSLKPSNAKMGIIDLSNKLKYFIESEIDTNEKFILIGFSMGCLISRYYLQELGGYSRCVIFHAVSGPHNGSLLAHFFIGQGAKDLKPNSEFIQQLRRTEYILEGVSIYSYRTPYDQMIIPSSSSHWDIAENYITNALIHRLMLQNELVLNIIEQSINELRNGS